MADDAPHETAQNQARHLNSLMRKSEHLGLFGTIVSLVSMLPYFYEKSINKELPPWFNKLTFATVGAGIVAMAGAVAYRLKAGRIAINSAILPAGSITPAATNIMTDAMPAPAPEPSSEIMPDAPSGVKKNWAAGIMPAPDAPEAAQMQR